MSEKKKVTEEMLDEAARKLAGRLDALLVALPPDHPDHFSSPEMIPNRRKKKGRPQRPARKDDWE